MTSWLLEGAIPSGAIVVMADADDPDPQTLIDAGADVVVHLGGRDPDLLSGVPFILSFIWRENLVPGRQSPRPFWVRWNGSTLVRVKEERAA